MRWQPIKTAPKDGTKILVYWPSMDHQSAECEAYFVVYWADVEAREIYDFLNDDDDPDAVAIVAGGWRFGAVSIDDAHTNECDMLVEWLHYSVTDGPTHWAHLPEPPKRNANFKKRLSQ